MLGLRLGMGRFVALAIVAGLACGCEKDDPPAPANPLAAPQPEAPAPAPQRIGIAILGGGTVRSTTSGVPIDCTHDPDTDLQSGTCSAQTDIDDVALVASPSAGWKFDHWEIARGEGNTSTVRPPDQTATFTVHDVTRVSGTSVHAYFVKTDAFTVGTIAPWSGLYGADVHISGTALGGTSAVVTFNGVRADVQMDSTDTDLHVFVPGGATSGPVDVRNGDKSGTTSLPFHVGLAGASWKVTWPDNRVCFDVSSGIIKAEWPVSNDPSGFTMWFAVNTVNGDSDSTFHQLRGSYADDGTFSADFDGSDFVGAGNELTYHATGHLYADGTGVGSIALHISQNGFVCDESGTFTINR